MVAVLGVAAVLWIYETKPKHLAQLQPPSITLTAAERSAAEAIPPYSDAIPVVTYHTVSDREPSAYTVSLENFTRQLAALRAAGFNSVKLGEFEDFVFGRPVALPSRPILITIDDGTATDYSTVDPILARYGYNAVAFLITGSIARPGKRSYYLSSDELDSLAGTGRWEFGGHTNRLHKFLPLPGRNSTTGPALDHLIRLPDGTPENHAGWRKRVSDDFTASQNYFEDQFGRTAFAFAYPFSAYGQSSNDPTVQQDLAAVLQEHGYRMAFIGEQEEPDRAVTAGDEPYHLQRFGIRATMTALDVLRHIKDSVPRPIPATLAVHDWVGTDADCAFTDAADTPSVRVTPTADFGRCRPELNNTRWTDYTFRTEVWGANRRTTAVISLRDAWPAPGGGHIDLSIGESSAAAREVVGKQTTSLGRIDFPVRGLPGPAPVHHVAMSVHGTTLVIEIDGLPPLTASIDPHIAAGGISLSVASTQHQGVLFANPGFGDPQ